MKKQSLTLTDAAEFAVLQKTLFRAGGSWPNGSQVIKTGFFKYAFISADGKLTTSNDAVSYERRIEDETTIYECIALLESLINQEPYLQRCGIKSKMPYTIDNMIRDQYKAMCEDMGVNPHRRLENLIALDIKCRILGEDLFSLTKLD